MAKNNGLCLTKPALSATNRAERNGLANGSAKGSFNCEGLVSKLMGKWDRPADSGRFHVGLGRGSLAHLRLAR